MIGKKLFSFSFLFLLLTKNLIAEFSVDSNFASYEKEAIHLRGCVRISHDTCKIFADQMVLNQQSNMSKTTVSAFRAEENVTLIYNEDFTVSSNLAIYKQDDSLSEENRQERGVITLYPTELERCLIHNKNGDIIRASKIEIDPFKKRLEFLQPKGFLIFNEFLTKGSLIPKDAISGKIFFESDFLIWDDDISLLTFLGKINICQKGFGELQTAREVRLSFTNDQKKRKIKEIKSLGETVLVHLDNQKKLLHTLTSYGNVTVDHIGFKTMIESPVDSNGNVLEGKQLYFNDRFGEIYADVALLDYREAQGSVDVEKLTLKGNVKILNRSSVNPEESEAFLQYALADLVEFYPKKMEMIMRANKNPVLFYDKPNQLEMSADGVKVCRDATGKKESVQSLGTARFSFDGRELEKLKTHLSLKIEKK